MIRTETAKGTIVLRDDAGELSPQELGLVQAGIKAGLAEFTVPTPENDQGRTAWLVRTWLRQVGGKPVATLVASQVANEHFEIAGPSVDLAPVAKGK